MYGRFTQILERVGVMVARFAASLQNTQAAQITLLYPEIANQWHPTKNGELTSDKVLSNTTKKVW